MGDFWDNITTLADSGVWNGRELAEIDLGHIQNLLRRLDNIETEYQDQGDVLERARRKLKSELRRRW